MFEDNSQTPGLVPVLPAIGLVEVRGRGFANPERQATMSELVPYFLGYGKVERNWSDTTLRTYGNSLRWIIRIIGDLPPQRIRLEHVLRVKADCVRRGAGNHHTATVVAALKSFLRFCQLSVGLETGKPLAVSMTFASSGVSLVKCGALYFFFRSNSESGVELFGSAGSFRMSFSLCSEQ